MAVLANVDIPRWVRVAVYPSLGLPSDLDLTSKRTALSTALCWNALRNSILACRLRLLWSKCLTQSSMEGSRCACPAKSAKSDLRLFAVAEAGDDIMSVHAFRMASDMLFDDNTAFNSPNGVLTFLNFIWLRLHRFSTNATNLRCPMKHG